MLLATTLTTDYCSINKVMQMLHKYSILASLKDHQVNSEGLNHASIFKKLKD